MLSKEGFWRGRPATLIQDQSIPSNLDSEIHLLGFLRFNFEFHSPNAVTFSTVSARSGANRWGALCSLWVTSFMTQGDICHCLIALSVEPGFSVPQWWACIWIGPALWLSCIAR